MYAEEVVSNISPAVPRAKRAAYGSVISLTAIFAESIDLNNVTRLSANSIF